MTRVTDFDASCSLGSLLPRHTLGNVHIAYSSLSFAAAFLVSNTAEFPVSIRQPMP